MRRSPGAVVRAAAPQVALSVGVALLVSALATGRHAMLLVVLAIAAASLLLRDPRLVRCFLAAAGIGLVVEFTGTWLSAWSYPVVDAAGLPAWLPLLWGFVAIGPVRAATELIHDRRPAPGSLAPDIAAMAAMLASFAALWRAVPFQFALVVAIAGAAFAVRRAQLEIFITGAVAGTMLEGIAIAGGAWRYASPAVAGLAVWVPSMWGVVAVVLSDLHLIALRRPRRVLPARRSATAGA